MASLVALRPAQRWIAQPVLHHESGLTYQEPMSVESYRCGVSGQCAEVVEHWSWGAQQQQLGGDMSAPDPSQNSSRWSDTAPELSGRVQARVEQGVRREGSLWSGAMAQAGGCLPLQTP